MTDLFSDIDVGEALVEVLVLSFKCQSAVTKGEVVVADTHASGSVVTISTADADALDPLGMAMKDGAAGEYIPVLVIGVGKATAGGAITAGNCCRCAANGKLQAMPGTKVAGDEEKIVARALQDFAADGDTGLFLFGGVV